MEAIKDAFSESSKQPDRIHLTVPTVADQTATLLLMPAWSEKYIGVKIATIHPNNALRSLPAVHASYVLKDAATGKDLAMFDGSALTLMRTAATSALASSILSRGDTTTMLMMGSGSLALPLILAHSAVRPIKRVICWNRSAERLEKLVREVRDATNLDVSTTNNPEKSLQEADIVSCATLSSSPLFDGHQVRPGTHVDLVGAYTPQMRESDTSLIVRSDIFVDTYEGARNEAGDLILAASESDWTFEDIVSDLKGLSSGNHPGRTDTDSITVFKSVGASIEDLAAARLAWEKHTDENLPQ